MISFCMQHYLLLLSFYILLPTVYSSSVLLLLLILPFFSFHHIFSDIILYPSFLLFLLIIPHTDPRSLEGIVDKLRSDELVDGVATQNLTVGDSDDEHQKYNALPGIQFCPCLPLSCLALPCRDLSSISCLILDLLCLVLTYATYHPMLSSSCSSVCPSVFSFINLLTSSFHSTITCTLCHIFRYVTCHFYH